MFYNCYNLISINLNNFNTSKVESMNGMFRYCKTIKSLYLGNFNVQNVRSFSYMFDNCRSLTNLTLPDLYSGNVLESTNNMFSYCTKLTSIDFLTFDLSNVENMESMFLGCSSLEIFHI